MRVAQSWLSVPATVDVVCVTEREESERKFRFAATLTYFYNSPGLQMGEYEREFSQKAAAEQWVNQFKGCQVIAHVNPMDTTDSCLLDSDLDALATH